MYRAYITFTDQETGTYGEAARFYAADWSEMENLITAKARDLVRGDEVTIMATRTRNADLGNIPVAYTVSVVNGEGQSVIVTGTED